MGAVIVVSRKRLWLKRLMRVVTQGSWFLAFSFVLFGLVRWLPGDPAAAFARASRLRETPELLSSLRAWMGLEEPLWLQWLAWWRGLVTQEWGRSWYTGRDIGPDMMQAMAYTAWISVQAVFFAVVLAIPSALFLVVFRKKRLARFIVVCLQWVCTVPTVVLAFIFVMIFSVYGGWLPVQGSHSYVHSVLPSAVLATSLWSLFTLLLRESLCVCGEHDSVQYARVSGVREWTIWSRFVLPRASLPLISWTLMQLANVLCGALIVEVWFSWPGFGRYFVEAIGYRDYPVIQATLLIMAVVFFGCNGVAEWWRRVVMGERKFDSLAS